MRDQSPLHGPALRARLLLLAGLAAAACGPASKSVPDGPPHTTAGTALAAAQNMTVTPAAGGSLASDDGGLTIDVPAGAVAAPTEFSVQRISNTSPGVGASYRIGPTGVAFAQLVTLTFRPPVAGTPVAGLSVMTRDAATGFWTAVQQNLVVDPVAGTLTVTAATFAASDWSLVAAATARDFYGIFTLVENLEYPLSATGSANLAYAGQGGTVSWYVVPGEIALAAPVPVGAATCTANPASVPLPTSVAELDLTRGRFDFGINGRWDATCSDAKARVLTATFDTLGANLVGCTRTFLGTPLVAADRLQGSMSTDCGARGSATATWDFRTCPTAAGLPCAPSFCHTAAAISCATGGPVCNDTTSAPDGATCGSGGVCVGGACSPCVAGAACVPANPCEVGSLVCSPTPSCTSTGVRRSDGTACGSGLACLSGTCSACVVGTACVPANPCDLGSLVCSPASACSDTGTPRSDGTACGSGLACVSGTCGACVAGTACTPANPCDVGSLACSPASACTDTGVPKGDGTACGSGLACVSGTCGACVAGTACTPANPCDVGSLACSPASACTDTGVPKGDGTACGAGLACLSGTCSACVAGTACTPANPCDLGSLACSPASVCTDTGVPKSDGTACGSGLACVSGTCGACVAGTGCVPANPCKVGSLACSPAPACTDTGVSLADGSACGAGLACVSGTCGACVAGSDCVPANPCNVGALTCSPVPACADTGVPRSDGTACGAGLACLSGTCGACVAGAACLPANPCDVGSLVCSPAPACADTGVPKSDGTACGAGLACVSGTCGACVAGAACLPANPCDVGSLVCSPAPACADTSVPRSDGTACGAGLACLSGACVTCVAGTGCVPANPCDLGSLVCSPTPACTDTLTPVLNGTACPAGRTCYAGACVPLQTIAGNRLATFWSDPPAGQTLPTLVTVPAPDTAVSPAPSARIPDGAGGWVTYPGGSFAPDGSFSIPGVPSGASYVVEYLLPGGLRTYADTAAAALDLGYDVLGRASPPLAAPDLDTLVTFTLDGPWNASGDQVEMASSSADVWDVLLPSAPIVPGTPATFVENWRASQTAALPLHLLDAGDALFLHQLATFAAAAPATSYLSSVAATSLTGITLASGSPAAIAGTLVSVAATGSAAVDWDLPAFEAFLADMLPAGAAPTSSGHVLVVGASPYALASPAPPPTAGSPELLVLPMATGSVLPGSRLTLGGLAYGQFLPSWWPEWRGVAFSARVDYLAAGATTPLSESVRLLRREPMSPAPPAPIAPAVSPVRTPAATTAAGKTTISWSAPSLPASPPAPFYVVEVYWLRASGSASVSSAVLRYATASTQVTIPAGVLTPGNEYYALITAQLSGALDSAPFRQANALHAAGALTTVFTP
jgi:hypothetical protein